LVRRTAEERKVGVVLCSHALWEIEVVADDVVILNMGQVAAAGAVADVIGGVQNHGAQRNALRIQVPTTSLAAAQTALEALPEVARAIPSGEAAGWLRVELVTASDGASAPDLRVNNRLLEALIRAEIPVLSFEAAGGRLNEVFLYLTEERNK
jgi:ABC-2 type transport system ATP-binding protein